MLRVVRGMGRFQPGLLNSILVLDLYAMMSALMPSQTNKVIITLLLVGLYVFLAATFPFASPWWEPDPTWRWTRSLMRYLAVLVPPWWVLAVALIVFQEPACQKSDLFFLVQFSIIVLFQNFFLYFRLSKEPLKAIPVGVGALAPLIITFIWPVLWPENPYEWPVSELALACFVLVLFFTLWNTFSVTSFLAYYFDRRIEAIQKEQKLREVEERPYSLLGSEGSTLSPEE